MITLAIWQILLAMFVSGFIGVLVGVTAITLAAAAGYGGDEERSEPE